MCRLTRADENDDERILPTERGRSKMGKERETRFSLTSGQTRWQRPADPTSHGEQHSFTSLSENRNHTNFRWTRNPPEIPATELDTNSTPNTLDHSIVQQTPADETPQVPESAVLVICHSSEERHISPDILTVSSQTPVPQLLGYLIEKRYSQKVSTAPSSSNDTSESKPFLIREPTLL